MDYEFKLPDIGEGLVEGEIVKWFVKVGDTVLEHQPLAAVLTDKAEVEVPSPRTGKVVKLFGKPGEKVKVHAPLAVIDVGGSAAANPSKAPTGSEKAAKPAPLAVRRAASKPAMAAADRALSPGSVTEPSGEEMPLPNLLEGGPPPHAARSATRRQTDVLATPMLRKMARDIGVDISRVPGTGPQGRVLEADLKSFQSGPAPAATPSDNSQANATPAVKALAAQLGVDLSRVKGTGPGRRIAEGDVRTAAPPARTAAPAPAQGAAYAPVSIPRQPGDEARPFAGIRRKIAERMQQSRRTAAHVTHMDECEMTALLKLRESLKKEAARKSVKLTFLPFIIRALVRTLDEFPLFNSALDEAAGEIVLRRARNIGIAVAAPQGLVVPNIKDAGGKDLWALAAEIAALAEKVRAGKIDLPALQGGTFTITNIGPIGGLLATPIVNHPEVAILGLMKLQQRPVARDGKVVARDMMNLALSFDHRVVDGAEAASFMNTLVKHLENPRTLLD